MSRFWCGYIFSLFCAVLAGFDLGFNVYALSLKETFNFTQTQVEVVASMCTIGMMTGWLQTILMRKLGYPLTLFALWALTSISSGLYSVAVVCKDTVHSYPYIVYSSQLILSSSLCMVYVTLSTICVNNFPPKHGGKLVGIYTAVICMGKFVFCGLLELFFEDDLTGFFLVLCIMCIVFVGLCSAFLYPVAMQQDSSECQSQTDQAEDNQSVTPDSKKTNTGRTESLTSEMISSCHFHAVFWSSVVFFSCTYTCLNNMTSISESMGSSDPLLSVYVLSLAVFIVRLVGGACMDLFSSEIFGFLLLTLACVSLTIAMFLQIFQPSFLSAFAFAGLVGVAQGLGLTIPISVLMFHFGAHHYGFLINAFFTMGGVFQILLQILTGYLYDAQVSNQADSFDHTCRGADCYRSAFVILAIIGVATGVIQAVVAIRSTLEVPKIGFCNRS